MMGQIYSSQGDTEQAIKNLSKAIELKPDDHELNSLLGVELTQNGDVEAVDAVIESFEQAIKLCEQSTGIAYVPEMFTQAEFQIFKSLDCELNMPTAFDLLMQVLYLEQDD